MTGLILYLIKSTVYLSVFYIFFMLVMRRTTFFKLNRIIFLIGTLVCFILPFINLGFVSYENTPIGIIQDALDEYYTEGTPLATSEEIKTSSRINIFEIIYLLGAAVSLLRTAGSYVQMRRILKSIPTTVHDDTKIKITHSETPSFSWRNHIVINETDLKENPAILIHEQAHVKHKHSYDLIAYIVVTTLQWFNPLVWIARSELMLLHEYEADDSTIRNGINATQYQLLLVKKAIEIKNFHLANGFNHSKLKNRITMMNKKETKKWMRLGYLVLIPVMALTMCCCSQSKNKKEKAAAEQAASEQTWENAIPFQLVEQKPTFNGENEVAFSKWINTQLTYPKECVKDSIQGRVTLSFIVSPDGKVCDVKVLRGVHELLDAEAVRAIKLSPDWTPGMHDGKAVPVSYTFPVIFQMK